MALVVGLFLGVASGQAQINFYWTAGSGNYTDPANWTTNGATGPLAAPPSASDFARFTNAATYTVTLDNSVTISSNIFNNASNTVATVTMETGAANVLNVATQFTVGNDSNSVTTVYFDSNATPGYNAPQGTIVLGRDGDGTLIVTNGIIDAAGVNMGTRDAGRGTLVISGPSTTFSFGENSSGFTVGASNSFGSSVVVTNGATLGNIINLAHGTFRFGSGPGYANTSNNTLLVASGGRVLFSSGTITIGNGSTSSFLTGGGPGSFSNVVTVGNGGTIDCGLDRSIKDGTSHTLFLGSSKGQPGSNNVLRVLAGGTVHSVSHLYITNDCVLDMVGGTYGGIISNSVMTLGGDVSNLFGTVQGYGTFLCAVAIGSNGATYIAKNTLGSMVFSNGLRVQTNAITQVELGANPAATFPTIVASNLTVRTGTFNVTAPGPFAAGTYLLFSNTCNNCTNQVEFQAPTVTNYPSPGFTYAIGYGTNVVGGGTNAILLTVSSSAFYITSIARSGNDVSLTWLATPVGTTNVVQVSSGTVANGSYNNSFVDLSTNIMITGATANYLDVGGAANKTNRYYRIRTQQ